MNLPRRDKPILFSVTDRDKEETIEYAIRMADMGFNIMCTEGTYSYFAPNGVPCGSLTREDALEEIKQQKIEMVFNTPTRGKLHDRYGFILRRTAMEFNTPCITSTDTLDALLSVMAAGEIETHHIPLGEYLSGIKS